MKRLAIIPARGGSKRVPGKNVRNLCGKPALAYTVEAALAAGLFSKVVVSTDSAEIAKVALDCGAEVPFTREPELADDFTPVSAVTGDALERVEAAESTYDFVAQLMPNCPLRTAEDIRRSHDQFERLGADSQISVADYGWQNPWWAVTLGATHDLRTIHPQEMKARSQDLPEAFCPSGAIWWAKASVLREAGTFHVPNVTGWVMPWLHALDIDTEDDWQLAELLMLARLKNQENSSG